MLQGSELVNSDKGISHLPCSGTWLVTPGKIQGTDNVEYFSYLLWFAGNNNGFRW